MRKYGKYLNLKSDIHYIKIEVIEEIENYLRDFKLFNNIIEIKLNDLTMIDELVVIMNCEMTNKMIHDFVKHFQLEYVGYGKNIVHVQGYNKETYSYHFKNLE